MKDKIVAKFGGSSLAESNQFRKVKEIVVGNSERTIVVPSAPGKRFKKDHKVTDLLYMCHQLASHGLNFEDVYKLVRNRYTDICEDLDSSVEIQEILDEVFKKIADGASRDYCASRGEHINARILAAYLDYNFVDSMDIIRFDHKGRFDEKATKELIAQNEDRLINAVVPGFYGANAEGEIVCFSRGGSDITGSILADAIDAALYENWTDVSGFLMADPKLVENPEPIASVTYRELRELSYMGAPVLHEEAIFPVREKGIPIHIKNTNNPSDMGTLIVPDSWPVDNKSIITGIAGKKDFTVISVEKTLMTADRGFLRKMISVFETNDIQIEHMPSSIDSISVIVSDKELNSKLNKVMEEISIYCNPDNIVTYPQMSLIAVVGRGMIKTKGISARIFSSLAENGVNVRMISQGSSELNVIIGVENKDFEKAISAIYYAFQNKEVNNEKI
jgi:aspartate kinase